MHDIARSMRVCVVIPTYNGVKHLPKLLESLRCQDLSFDLRVVDSGSNDGSFELLKAAGVDVVSIEAVEFNHGGTRQLMVNGCSGYEVCVFLTQDAFLADSHSLSRIIEPFFDARVGAVCGRQLPHLDATPFAEHARLFNYPDVCEVRSISDVPRLGIKSAFMSNSFAAYRRSALMDVGGFPTHVVFAEDMFAAAKMLIAGWKIAYSGDARCHHSHNYSFIEEFERYFDMGVFHSRENWIRVRFGGAGGEGIRFIISEIKFLGFSRIHIWHSAFFRNAFKLLGFQLGKRERLLPIWLKKRFGMYKRYWDGPFKSSKIN